MWPKRTQPEKCTQCDVSEMRMSEENQANVSIPKFCPICGDTMHLEERDAGTWWVCDDESCDYQMKP